MPSQVSSEYNKDNGNKDDGNKAASARNGSKLSSNMSERTHRRLSSLHDKPGLAFYMAYAHVSDVDSHLSSIAIACKRIDSEGNEDPYSYSTLLSCTLTAQELLLGLLYRYNVIDFRPGVDKSGLGLLVGEIVRSFSSVLQVATSLELENTLRNQPVHRRRNSEVNEPKTSAFPIEYPPLPSMLSSLSDATSLGLICPSSKSALGSVVALLNDQKSQGFFKMTAQDDTYKSLSRLRTALGVNNPSSAVSGDTKRFGLSRLACTLPKIWRKVLGVNNPSSAVAGDTNSFGLSYCQLACTIPKILLQSHTNGSSHGPEDYTFQVAHVILELFFWYIENDLLPQAGLENKTRFGKEGSEKSEVLILLCSILDICAKVMSILDLMLLADFHPLRVAVHGSSGLYSEAWHRIRAWFSRTYRITSKSMNLNQIHLCPEMFVKESLYLQRLDRASASFRAFSFRHYVLAQRTIGSNSMGSAGKNFEQMQSSFLPHPNQKSNEAKYRVHEYTNVKYAEFVGLGTEAVAGQAKVVEDLNNIRDKGDDKNYTTYPATKQVLEALERCFIEADVKAFVDLFDITNCCIEHPLGTLAYLGTDIKSYFFNMRKKHPVFHSFNCSSSFGTNINIDVDADLFDGTRAKYRIQGVCEMDKDGSKILRITLDGKPDISKELCEGNDQRIFSWTSASQKNNNAVLEGGFRRQLAPAEVLAYELNINKSGKAVSDGLTIVARSLVCGNIPSDERIQNAVDQIARRNVLLTAWIDVTAEGYYFVTGNQLRQVDIKIVESKCRLNCAPYLNTQFKCNEGDMFRVILTKLGPSTSGPSFELITVMFHGICDAICVRDLHMQILNRLALLNENSDSTSAMSVLNEKNLPSPLPPSALHFAKKALSKRATPAAEPLPLPDPAPIYVQCEGAANATEEMPKSMYITRKLDANHTKALIVSCKRKKTTVHAAIGAASLLAANCGESKRKVLTSAVDLRRRLDIPSGDVLYSVGGFDGSAAFEYDVTDYEQKEDKFWELCLSIRRDLVDTIDSGRLLTTYASSVEGLVEAYKGGFLDDGVFGTVFLSNIGRETYQKDIGPFKWLDFDYLYGQFLPGGPHYHITCSTFAGHLNLNFQYVSPTIPDNEANSFVDSTMALLMQHMHNE